MNPRLIPNFLLIFRRETRMTFAFVEPPAPTPVTRLTWTPGYFCGGVPAYSPTARPDYRGG